MFFLHAFYYSYTLFYIFLLNNFFFVLYLYLYKIFILTFKLDTDQSSVQRLHVFALRFFFKLF